MTRRRSIAAILATLGIAEALIVALLILPALSDDPPATIQATTESNEVRNPTDTPVPRSERLAPYPPTPTIPPDAPPCTAAELTVAVAEKGNGGMGWASVPVTIANQSTRVCIFQGPLAVSGVSGESEDIELHTKPMCHTEPCTIGTELVAVLHPSSTLRLDIVVSALYGRACEESPGELVAFRLAWSSSSIDIPKETHLCDPAVGLYWRG